MHCRQVGKVLLLSFASQGSTDENQSVHIGPDQEPAFFSWQVRTKQSIDPIVSNVMGTCVDHDHPEYGKYLQSCETHYNMCEGKCNGDGACIKKCRDDEKSCIGKFSNRVILKYDVIWKHFEVKMTLWWPHSLNMVISDACPCCKVTERAKCTWKSLDDIEAEETIFHQLKCASMEDVVHIE